jgi:hypothetical protein
MGKRARIRKQLTLSINATEHPDPTVRQLGLEGKVLSESAADLRVDKNSPERESNSFSYRYHGSLI